MAHYLVEGGSAKAPVNFLWLELTNQCNLQCTHCYADSGPKGQRGTLSFSKYRELMLEAFELGCRRVQFIGGEPTMNKDLPELLAMASRIGYDFIEVYTNLTRLTPELLQCFVTHRVSVATSVYGANAAQHEVVTQVAGSFDKTVTSLRRLIAAGVPVRAGVISMEANRTYAESTVVFLRDLGIKDVGVDRVRQFGRGASAAAGCNMSELCGSCADGTLCISPTGDVTPCIMSKAWGVGSVLNDDLTALATGGALRDIRDRIQTAVEKRRTLYANCNPTAPCSPQQTCHPQSCDPNRICYPNHCDPNRISQ